ncbi:MAG: fused MFS/spermidine synthase [Chloroflexota bacterium]
MSNSPPLISKRLLYFTVFIGGMSTLAIEFTISRILQTVYGTSNIVWANVIGLVLFFLTVGYFLGGRLADRRPESRIFFSLITLAGFSSIFFLLLSSFLVKQTATALATFNSSVIIGSFVGVIIGLAIPITLLGMVSPFAIRLAVTTVEQAGRISGQIYAISTLGSLLGTWLPVLIVIPLAGSRMTAIIFGGILFALGLFGLWYSNGRLDLAALIFVLIPAVWAFGFGNLTDRGDAIYETESAYNYIQVIRRDPCNYLLLNEGAAFHSFYCDDGSLPAVSVWSSMLAGPYFYPPDQFNSPKNMLVIGLAGGTVPQQFLRIFPDLAVIGIEPDPAIIEVGQTYFALSDPRIQPIVGDGRFELNQINKQFDVITIDAYKVPYIPWHLTTVEFFEEVSTKLTDRGIVAINVGRVPNDRRLVEALTATLETVFPTVHTADIPGSLNTILYATAQPTSANGLVLHITQLPKDEDPLLPAVLSAVQSGLRPSVGSEIIFTDDVAPVETIVDSLVLRYLVQSGLQGLPTTE